MSRSVAQCMRIAPCLAFVAALAGCAAQAPFTPVQIRHGEGEHVVTGADLEVELVSTRYLERGVEVAVLVRNRHEQEVTLGREGMLVTVGDLEYPLDPLTGAAEPATWIVPGLGAAKLTLRFTTGAPVDDGAVLVVRAAARNATWLRVDGLAIAPAPIAEASVPGTSAPAR